MSVVTVTGEIEKHKLGITLPHEHLMIDLRDVVETPQPPPTGFYDQFTAEKRYLVYSDPYAVLDNAVYLEEGIALKELLLYKAAGGNTVVDVTLRKIGRDPLKLKELSEKSGVKIVMGCGQYIASAHDKNVATKTAKELAKDILQDVYNGIDGVKSGVIGEIGTSVVITEDERKCLLAAGIAGADSGKAIHVHTSLWEENGLEAVRVLLGEGVNVNKICIDHVDVNIRLDYIERLLDMGVFVEFDNFGKEFFIKKRSYGTIRGRFAMDIERVRALAELIKKGYLKQLLVANDICLKSMLTNYGGNGFAHVITSGKAMLEDFGVSDKQIEKLFIDNPADFLD